MPQPAPTVIPYKINLAQSIDTDTPDLSISPLDATQGPALHVKNTGIERAGGVRNLYEKIVAKLSNYYIQYTKQGNKVSTTATDIYIDDTQLPVSASAGLSVSFRKTLPGTPDDAIVAGASAAVTLKVGTGSTSVLQKFTYTSGAWVAGGTVSIIKGYADYIRMTIIRPSNTASITAETDIKYLLCQKADYSLDVLTVATGAVLFSITGLASAGEFTSIHYSTTKFFIVRRDTQYTWTWNSTGPALTAYDGYGFPEYQDGLSPATLKIYRVPVVGSKLVGKYFTITSTTATDIELTDTPTGIEFYKLGLGGLFCSYAKSGGYQTDLLYSTVLSAAPTLKSLGARRMYLTEMVGTLNYLYSIMYINDVQSYICTSAPGYFNYGGPLCEIGALDRLYVPTCSSSGSIVYKNNFSEFIFIGVNFMQLSAIAHSQLLNDQIVEINTLGATTIVDADNKVAAIGASGFNGSLIIDVPYASPGVSLTIAARLGGKYAAGVDTGEKIITNVGTLIQDRYYYMNGLINSSYESMPIDIYENGIYTTTAIGGTSLAITKINAAKIDEIYVQSDIIPPPVGHVRSGNGIQFDEKIAFTEYGMVGYKIGNELNKAGKTFDLFGNTYLFDGETIYSCRFNSAGVIQDAPKQVDGLGLTYLCSTTTEALFLSSWDNCIYSYDGGKTLARKIRMPSIGAILAGAYCAASDEVALYATGGTVLYIRNGIITQSTLGITATGTISMQPDKDGIWVIPQYGVGNYSRVQYLSTGGTLLPLDFQTAYQGLGFNKKARFNEYVFTLYNAAKTASTVQVDWIAFDEYGIGTTQTRTITPAWDAQGYARISFIPADNEKLAASIRVYAAAMPLTILDAYVYVEDIGTRALVENRGA